MENQFDVFISYSDKDKQLASKIYDGLTSEGLKCWIAYKNLPTGKVWSEGIVEGIMNSRIFLLILTQHSNISKQVLREVQIADNYSKGLYCCKLENIEVNKGLDFYISTVHQFEAQNLTIEIILKKMLIEFKGVLGIEISPESLNNEDLDKQKYLKELADAMMLNHYKKYDEALIPLLRLADKGIQESYYEIACMYYEGTGVKKNKSDALKWLLKFTEKTYKVTDENSNSIFTQNTYVLIGNIYEEGEDGVKRDYIEAMNWYIKSADLGSSDAMYHIGKMYHSGNGVGYNFEQAKVWMQKAKDLGSYAAEYWLIEYTSKSFWDRLFPMKKLNQNHP